MVMGNYRTTCVSLLDLPTYNEQLLVACSVFGRILDITSLHQCRTCILTWWEVDNQTTPQGPRYLRVNEGSKALSQVLDHARNHTTQHLTLSFVLPINIYLPRPCNFYCYLRQLFDPSLNITVRFHSTFCTLRIQHNVFTQFKVPRKLRRMAKQHHRRGARTFCLCSHERRNQFRI